VTVSSLRITDVFQLYLVRSVRFQQLVVARTPDSCYVTIPRDCPLTFRLLNHDDQRQYMHALYCLLANCDEDYDNDTEQMSYWDTTIHVVCQF